MKWVCHILLLLVSLCANGLHAQSIFSDELYTSYKRAFDLNEEGCYLDAYRSMLSTRDMMLAEMEGRTVQALSVDDYLNYWWPINRSVAEIAYRIGLYDVMLTIADQMDSSMAYFDIQQGTYLAQLLKLDAGRHFLTADLNIVEIELRRAIELASPFDIQFLSDLHDELAQLYYRQKHYDMALQQLDSVLPHSELSGQKALCLARLGRFDEALSLLEESPSKTSPPSYRSSFSKTEHLRQRAKVLSLQYESTGSFNPSIRRLYTDYLRQSRQFIESNFFLMSDSEREMFWMAEQPFVTDCYRLEDKAPELLYDVALFGKALLLQLGRKLSREDVTSINSKTRKKILAEINVTWRQVQRKLSDSAAAIEFVVYEKEDVDHLGALVLKKKGKPVFIHISTLARLLNHTVPNGETVESILPRTGDANAINSLYGDTLFHELIWNDSLIDAIDGCSTVYFSPDGILHRIPIEYMLSGRRIHRLTSTRLIVESSRKIRTDSVLMVGAIDYDESRDDTAAASYGLGNDCLAYQLLYPLHIKLNPLDGSKAEIEAVNNIRNCANDRLLLADSATETMVCKLLDRYSIVLLSTHGWVDDAALLSTDLRPATSDAQLSQSCLFFSGAGHNLVDSSFNYNHRDGILSARELAALDLSNVDLAVLSACVSGLGQITPDGIYGLQRGLKTAGVRSVIVSLWDVNDYATSLFIKFLYSSLEQGMTLYEAFNNARLQIRDSSVRRRIHGRNKYTSLDRPYFTDAFILIDGI